MAVTLWIGRVSFLLLFSFNFPLVCEGKIFETPRLFIILLHVLVNKTKTRAKGRSPVLIIFDVPCMERPLLNIRLDFMTKQKPQGEKGHGAFDSGPNLSRCGIETTGLPRVREKSGKNKIFSRSGNCQGILKKCQGILAIWLMSGKCQGILSWQLNFSKND